MRRFSVRLFSFLVILISLSAALLPAAGSCETVLRGYEEDGGYVYVLLGQYPQTAEGEVQPILWRVLASDSEKCILLSEYILFARCINASLTEYRDEIKGDLGKTDLCEYLNIVFASDAFSEDDLSLLLPMEGVGRIFIPSAEDLQNKAYGLGVTVKGVKSSKKILSNPGLRAWGTEWAVKNNGYNPVEYPNPRQKVTGSSKKEMPVKELRLFVYSAGWASHSPYWTRDASAADPRQARDIKASGSIGRLEVGRDNVGVRPMIWLAQGGFDTVSGAGTKEDPWVIVRKGE